MTLVTVAAEPARQSDVEQLLRLSEEYAHSLYPADSCYLLTVDELEKPGITVFVARDDHTAVGMSALVDNRDATGEVKRMFVVEPARGRGVASALLDAVEAGAINQGVRVLRLETGHKQPAAVALYARHGYHHIPKFGQYVGDDLSVCMEKSLPASNRG